MAGLLPAACISHAARERLPAWNCIMLLLTRMMLRLKMLLLPIKLLISSKKLSVMSPPIWLKEMSTTMLSTRHLSSFTCSHKADNKHVAHALQRQHCKADPWNEDHMTYAQHLGSLEPCQPCKRPLLLLFVVMSSSQHKHKGRMSAQPSATAHLTHLCVDNCDIPDLIRGVAVAALLLLND